MAKKILITGGSGLVGSALTQLLLKKGYEVAHLSRKASQKGPVKAYAWDYLSRKMDSKVLVGVHGIVHLAGAGIADSRWTDGRKREIIESRVKTAGLLFDTCESLGHWPEVFLSAGGINYYGSVTSDKIFDESDPPSRTFIGDCCVLWEAAAKRFEAHSRVAILRTGVVLSADGGALPKIAAPVKFGFGAPLGSGKQWMPYLHIEDLCQMYHFALENEMVKGSYNASNGDHITNRDLTRAVAKSLRKPLWLPAVPAFVLKLALGEVSEIVLEGSRASADKIKSSGFKFSFAQLHEALQAIYQKD